MPTRPSSHRPLSSPYGAAELQEFQPRALLMSFLFSAIVVQSLAALIAWGAMSPADDSPSNAAGRDTVAYHVLWNPPINLVLPHDRPGRASIAPRFGIPVPISDVTANTSIEFATTEELQAAGPTDGEGTGPGTVVVDPPVVVEEPEPPVFVIREVEPTIAVRVDPVYPAVALRAGLEGNVYVSVWVDTKGSVRKAVVVKSDGAVFDEAALEAVRGWVFTPALMQNRPVSVWVTVPFRFRMQGR